MAPLAGGPVADAQSLSHVAHRLGALLDTLDEKPSTAGSGPGAVLDTPGAGGAGLEPCEAVRQSETCPPGEAMRTITSKLRVVLVNLLVLATGMIVAEMIFGNWFSPNRLNALNLVKGVERSFDVNHLYKRNRKKAIYRRDRYGLRGNYGSLDRIDVLTVGGSATDQRAISEGETWQDVLQREFSKRGRAVNIANGGVEGQTTYGHIKNFDWWFPVLPNLKVKYFLFYIGANDFYKGPDSAYDDLYGVPASNFLRLKREVKERSALYYLYRTAGGILRAHEADLHHRMVNFQTLEWGDTPLVTDPEGLMRTRLRDYRTRLRVLNLKVAQAGAIPIDVTQPIRRYKHLNGKWVGVARPTRNFGVEINGVDTQRMMQLLHVATMEECRDGGGVCIDLANELEFDDDDFYDFFHNTPKGTEKIGRYLYAKINHLFP